MQKNKDNNSCLITGVVVASNKSADNVDMKRPVITIEILHTSKKSNDFMFENDVFLEEVPVLLAGHILAKSIVGIALGDVLNIYGRICIDNHEGLYIEASTIQKIVPAPKGSIINSIAAGRSEMLQLSQIFNKCEVMGTIKKITEDMIILNVPRIFLVKGDLTNNDQISVIYSNHVLKTGDKILVKGTIGIEEKILSIFADNIYKIEEVENI